MAQKRTFLPRWLKALLTAAVVVTFFTVTGLMALTVRAAMQRPFNPIENAGLAPNDPVGTAVAAGSPLLPVISITDRVLPGGEAADPDVLGTAEAAGTRRTTVLVMGVDSRPGEGIITRTDTMLVLSLDKDNQTASMLSIPRDLYVDIPGHGRDRINTALIYGARGGGAAIGAQVAMQTVADTLGIAVDHYLIVDFTTVVRMIDTVGGVTIDVPYNIYDPLYPDMNYGYDPFEITAGTHTLDGATALKYMRTRHSDNDFYRAQRQQQVIMAFRSQALSLGLGSLIARAPVLYQQISGGVFTDMSLEEMLGLARIAGEIEREQIDSDVIDYDFVSSYTTPGGASVLILDPDKIQPRIAELFQ